MKKILAAGVLAVTWAVSGVAADTVETGISREVAEQPSLRWQVAVLPAQAKPGDEVEVVFSADIAPGWILYSSDFNLEIGPRPTKFTFDGSSGLTLLGAIQPVRPRWKNDRSLGGKYSYFSGRAQFRQKARLVAPPGNVSGRISGQTCFEENGLCKLFAERFSTHLAPPPP